jgi:hypothetical protein
MYTLGECVREAVMPSTYESSLHDTRESYHYELIIRDVVYYFHECAAKLVI